MVAVIEKVGEIVNVFCCFKLHIYADFRLAPIYYLIIAIEWLIYSRTCVLYVGNDEEDVYNVCIIWLNYFIYAVYFASTLTLEFCGGLMALILNMEFK